MMKITMFEPVADAIDPTFVACDGWISAGGASGIEHLACAVTMPGDVTLG